MNQGPCLLTCWIGAEVHNLAQNQDLHSNSDHPRKLHTVECIDTLSLCSSTVTGEELHDFSSWSEKVWAFPYLNIMSARVGVLSQKHSVSSFLLWSRCELMS